MGGDGKSGGAALDRATQIRFEAGIHGIEQLSTGNDHNVETLARLEHVSTPENLSYQSLSAISPHGIPELPRRHDPQPGCPGIIGGHEHRRISSLYAKREVEDPLKLVAVPDSSALRKTLGLPWHVSRIGPRVGLRGGNREAFAPLRPAPFKHMAAVLRRHTHEESMRALSAPAVWLERHTHCRIPVTKER
jgi:hypothetical protein